VLLLIVTNEGNGPPVESVAEYLMGPHEGMLMFHALNTYDILVLPIEYVILEIAALVIRFLLHAFYTSTWKVAWVLIATGMSYYAVIMSE
jgi:hypothetical protein